MPLTQRDVYFRLKDIIAELNDVKPSSVLASQNLREELQFDDKALVGLTVAINKAFEYENIEIKPEDLFKTRDVGDITKLIWTQLERQIVH